MKTQRICIYAMDIQRITGKSEKTGYKMLGAIQKKLGKRPHQFVTTKEFANYTGIPLEDVSQYSSDK